MTCRQMIQTRRDEMSSATSTVRYSFTTTDIGSATMSNFSRPTSKLKTLNLLALITCALIYSSNPSQSLSIDSRAPQQNQVPDAINTNESKTPANINVLSPLQMRAQMDLRRPIWALAHMVNSIKELDYRLERGANAVEVDVTFGRDGDPLYTYHGPPCDCWRHCYQQEEFNQYLSHIREIAIDTPNGIGQNLSLLFLDLKLETLSQQAKIRAGNELAKSVMSHLFTNEFQAYPIIEISSNLTDSHSKPPRSNETLPMYLIVSVNHVQDIDLIFNFVNYLEVNNSTHLLQRIGFDVGMNDDLQSIERMWRRFGSNLNLWQGDGFTNCFSPFYNLERLTKALLKRDSPIGFPTKVYHWTIDLHDRIRESLRLGVDAIMTNHPERVLNVLQEPELAHEFRLATRHDDPFKKLTRESVGRASGETARYQRSASVTTGGFLGNLVDVLTSWYNYVREIPFLSLPTTLFSASSARTYRQRTGPTGNNNNRTSSVALVKLQNQSPEYQMAEPGKSIQEPQSLDGSKSTILADTDASQPYDGPKWFTTLASNTLVSMMKVFLPSQAQ